MKQLIFLSIIVTLNFTGCTTCPEPLPPKTLISYEEPSIQKLSQFRVNMGKVARTIKDDSQYNKMSLNTQDKKEWFKNLMFQLWDRQITRKQFIELGLEQYPTHYYEFEFVANGFQKN